MQCRLRSGDASARLRLLPAHHLHPKSSHVFRLLHYNEGTLHLSLGYLVSLNLFHSLCGAVALRGATPAAASHLHRHCVGVLGGSALLLPSRAFFFRGEQITLHRSASLFYRCICSLLQLTPAMSRRLNSECILLDFFDGHDVWHFLSSMALFFGFMVSPTSLRSPGLSCFMQVSLQVLLTLDDDLDSVPRREIKVF